MPRGYNIEIHKSSFLERLHQFQPKYYVCLYVKENQAFKNNQLFNFQKGDNNCFLLMSWHSHFLCIFFIDWNCFSSEQCDQWVSWFFFYFFFYLKRSPQTSMQTSLASIWIMNSSILLKSFKIFNTKNILVENVHEVNVQKKTFKN